MPRSSEKKDKKDDSNESSEEDLTEQQVQDLKTELGKSLPATEVDKIGNVFSKFTAGKSDEEKLAGVVCY